MQEVILRTPAKRYWGKSKSGKAEVFITKANSGEFYAIPLWAVISRRSYEKRVNDSYSEPMLELRFKAAAMEGQSTFAVQLKRCLTHIASFNETTVLQ
jgi:hypothetical protein